MQNWVELSHWIITEAFALWRSELSYTHCNREFDVQLCFVGSRVK